MIAAFDGVQASLLATAEKGNKLEKKLALWDLALQLSSVYHLSKKRLECTCEKTHLPKSAPALLTPADEPVAVTARESNSPAARSHKPRSDMPIAMPTMTQGRWTLRQVT